GSVTITANGAVSVSGGISGNAGGSTTEGGGTGADIEITAVSGSLTITAAISADSGFPDGSAGQIDLTAGIDLLQSGPISAAGRGGAVILRACQVAVNAGALVSSLGLTGENLFQASGPMTIAGTVTSAANRFEYLDPTRLPQILSGAVVAPPPVIAANMQLAPCGTPPAQCGNHVVEDGEQCDDGNNRSCDGCSSSCTTEGCGNGVTECDEQCDDGARNGTTGDGCDASCHLVGTVRYVSASHIDSSDCFLEWAIENPNGRVVNGFPSANQACIDGDPSCDADGASDGTCTFRLGACINVDDARLPTCHPPAIKVVALLRPAPLSPADATDVTNLGELVPA